MPSTAINSSTLAAPTPRTPPKRCNNFARFFAPMPAISSSLLLPVPVRTLARFARMPVIAKRCASSDLRHQHQRGGVGRQRQLLAAVGEHELLEAHLAARSEEHTSELQSHHDLV